MIPKSIRHISFDVWNTLITPNPTFGRLRIALACSLIKQYNPSAVTEDLEHRVQQAYNLTKKQFDDAASMLGYGYPCKHVIKQFLLNAGVPFIGNTNAMIEQFIVDQNRLFRENPPTLMNGAKAFVHDAVASYVTISILSNTNFVPGETLGVCVSKLLDVEFDFMLFSDEIECAKPSVAAFDRVYDATALISNSSYLYRRSNIVHIGDHPVCDVQGAQNAGIRGALYTPKAGFSGVVYEYQW